MSVLPTVWRPDPELPRVRLEGVRVVLEPPRVADWAEWENVRRRNQSYLQSFEPLWPEDCLSRDFFKRRLKRQQWDWENDMARYFLIRLREDGALIGGINLNQIHLGAARHASLGYWLDEARQGQGYMAESAALVIDYAFRTLNLQRVHAACVPENERSIRLIKRLGLSEEGFVKEYIQINGVWRDHHLFGLTRSAYSRMA